jgi:transposase
VSSLASITSSRRWVRAAKSKSAATVDEFFKALGPERAAKLKGVTMDMSAAYIDAVHRALIAPER